MSKLIVLVAAVLAMAVAVHANTTANQDGATKDVLNGKPHLSTWLMFEITHHGEIHLKAARKSHQPKGLCKGHPETPDGHVLITYTDPESGNKCVVRAPDPRKEYHDHDAGNGKLAGGIRHHQKVEFAVTVHKDVDEFHTHDLKNAHLPQKRHMITQEHHRAFETMQTVTIDAAAVVSSTLQFVGPLQQQKNIVFISSGYTAAEQTKFDTDVETLMRFVQLPDTASLSSQPYRRYFSMINFFKIWYPSAESGASHPAPAGAGTSVNNNLDCTYGATSERILTCNRAKIQLVASHAPPDPTSTIYLIMVNDNTFGGTGGSGICTTYTGPEMKVIFIHEVNHAGADLADEYDYGYAESQQIAMPNCHWSNTGTPWERWVLAQIIPQPTQVCTYSNYFKPTPSSCLMESNQPSMCPVCASHVLTRMYNHGLNLASPRFPGMYETAYVRVGEGIILFINSRVPSHKDETGTFDVVWTVEGHTLAAPVRGTHAFGFNIMVNGTMFAPPGPGTYIVNATITDNTNMLLEFTRNDLANRNGNNATALRQIATFRVVVYDPLTVTIQPNCTNRSTAYNTFYCGECDPGHDADCSGNYATVPLEQVTDVEGQLSGLQDWLLGIGGLFIALGILIFILIWRMMALHAEHNPREILPLTFGIVVVRIILLVVQITLLIGSSCSIIFSVYMYGQLSIFGRTLMLGVIASSVVVWFSSFVGFCAAYYRNRAVLFVNFILLLLLFGCALLFTTLILYMLFNIDDPSVKQQLDGEWRAAVASDPQATCTIQSVLECSGFNTSCNTVAYSPAGTSNCPGNCERSNQFGDPCFLRVRDFVRSKFGTASIGGILLCVFILAAMILALVLGCSIKTRRNHVHRQRVERQKRGEPALTPEEIAMLRREFDKIDKDGSGDISREEFSTFYNAVMGVSLTPRELEEYFDKLDADGNGVLSFDEFVKVYVPQKQAKRKNLAKTKSMIYAAGSAHSATPAEEAVAPGGGNDFDGTAKSQRPAQQARQDINLELALDDDMEVDMSPEENARAQEERAKEEAARVAQAQAERQRRLKEDRPSNMDVDLVVDDNQMGGTFMGGTLDDGGAGVNLDLDLDDEQFE